MAKKLDTTEYAYSTPRFRYAEANMLTLGDFAAMCDMNITDVVSKLEDRGIAFDRDAVGLPILDSAADKMISRLYNFVDEIIPNPDTYELFRFPYYCHNLKAEIKGDIRGIETEELFYDFGEVEYPVNMNAAAVEARAAYERSQNPQIVDILLDKACYADMLNVAEKSNCALILKLVKAKIDMSNALTLIRIKNMRLNELYISLFTEAYIPGGTLDLEWFSELYTSDMKAIAEALEHTEYVKLAHAIYTHSSGMSHLELAADNTYMEIARYAKSISFGPEVAAGYIVAKEAEIKNIRIVLSGIRGEAAPDKIRERFRDCYV